MKKHIIILALFLLSACSTGPNDDLMPGATLLGGAAIGAGTGAAVGSMISGGNVGESAALGAAIGAPVALGGRYLYIRHKQDTEINKNNEIIENNYNDIKDRQYQLDTMRRHIIEDTPVIEPTDENPRYFEGSTIGYE